MPRGRSQIPDPGAQALEQGAVVADDEQSQAPALPLPEEKLPDLGLGDQVQHGGDLVAQEIAGGRAQGPGDTEPLELAPDSSPG